MKQDSREETLAKLKLAIAHQEMVCEALGAASFWGFWDRGIELLKKENEKMEIFKETVRRIEAHVEDEDDE